MVTPTHQNRGICPDFKGLGVKIESHRVRLRLRFYAMLL
jgi:hypothetical protein